MKKFIPAFRLKAAKMMVNDYGIKQQQAAAILGTTQAAISKYLKESPEKFKDISIDEDLLANFVEKTTKNEKDGQRIMCRMCQDNKKFNCTFIVK